MSKESLNTLDKKKSLVKQKVRFYTLLLKPHLISWSPKAEGVLGEEVKQHTGSIYLSLPVFFLYGV